MIRQDYGSLKENLQVQFQYKNDLTSFTEYSSKYTSIKSVQKVYS